MKKKNIVIGVGNMLFKDEGIGIYASEYIKQNYEFDDKELEELMAVMTFGLSRFNNNYEYEMYRFCSKLDTTVVGGAAKLLKYFKDKYAPNSICSYAARSWSRGDLYDKLGFSLLYKTEPSYSYHRRTEKVSRYQAQKHKLAGLLGTSFDPSLTEEENMAKVQFYRVYDSGNLLYGWISGNKRIDTITN